jgi:hypothetical protein
MTAFPCASFFDKFLLRHLSLFPRIINLSSDKSNQSRIVEFWFPGIYKYAYNNGVYKIYEDHGNNIGYCFSNSIFSVSELKRMNILS